MSWWGSHEVKYFFCRFYVGKTGGNSFFCFFCFCWENWWKFIRLFFEIFCWEKWWKFILLFSFVDFLLGKLVEIHSLVLFSEFLLGKLVDIPNFCAEHMISLEKCEKTSWFSDDTIHKRICPVEIFYRRVWFSDVWSTIRGRFVAIQQDDEIDGFCATSDSRISRDAHAQGAVVDFQPSLLGFAWGLLLTLICHKISSYDCPRVRDVYSAGNPMLRVSWDVPKL